MSTTTLEVFDSTLQKTNVWLKDIMSIMKWTDYHKAYTALRSVLHAVRDRLTPEVAVKVGAQMPMLIRGFYYEGWRPTNTPLRVNSKEDFFDLVTSEISENSMGYDIEEVVKAVCTVVKKHLTAGEVEHIKSNMPHELQSLWK